MQRIVIAGNDQSWLGTVAAYLWRIGFQVETADGGVECVRKLRASRPFALVVDAGLLWGGVDGVLEMVRKEFAYEGGPLVVIIGDSPRCSKAFASTSQRIECLPKRTDPRQIAATILGTTKELSLSYF